MALTKVAVFDFIFCVLPCVHAARSAVDSFSYKYLTYRDEIGSAAEMVQHALVDPQKGEKVSHPGRDSSGAPLEHKEPAAKAARARTQTASIFLQKVAPKGKSTSPKKAITITEQGSYAPPRPPPRRPAPQPAPRTAPRTARPRSAAPQSPAPHVSPDERTSKPYPHGGAAPQSITAPRHSKPKEELILRSSADRSSPPARSAVAQKLSSDNNFSGSWSVVETRGKDKLDRFYHDLKVPVVVRRLLKRMDYGTGREYRIIKQKENHLVIKTKIQIKNAMHVSAGAEMKLDIGGGQHTSTFFDRRPITYEAKWKDDSHRALAIKFERFGKPFLANVTASLEKRRLVVRVGGEYEGLEVLHERISGAFGPQLLSEHAAFSDSDEHQSYTANTDASDTF